MGKSRLVTIHFSSSVSASSKITLVSKRIDLPFRTKKIRVFFGENTSWNTKVYLYISPDDSAPTTEAPTGTNLLDQLSHLNYLLSNGDAYDFLHEVEIPERGMYLKVYIDNTDAYPHDVAATITIEILPTENPGKFECECISCGNIIESDKHCIDIKCSECGGDMRRKDRPGPGQ